MSRGYPSELVKRQLKKVKETSRETLLSGKNVEKKVGVPLIITYHPRLSNFGDFLKKNFYLLQVDPEVRKLFQVSPFVSFQSGYSLRNHLVRAKVQPLKREVGSDKCGKKSCMVCKNVVKTKFFKSNVTKESYKINHHFSCDDKCLIYLLTCNCCGIQYVGQTSDKFRLRWNNYKASARKVLKGELCTQMDFHRHFLEPNHNGFLQNCSITFIDKTDPGNPCAREKYWIYKLKTLKPFGLNTEDSAY